MTQNAVTFGWGAPPMIEQHPVLDENDAHHFDLDNQAVIRLSARGLITPSQRDAAIKKITKAIEKKLVAALGASPPHRAPSLTSEGPR